MSGVDDNRYAMRPEDDGTWTVYHTQSLPGIESRIMYGISEDRARKYIDHLNSRLAKAAEKSDISSPAACAALFNEEGEDAGQPPEELRDFP